MAYTRSRHGNEACKSERPVTKPDGGLGQFRCETAATEIAEVSRSCRRACALSRGLGDQNSVARRLMVLPSEQRLVRLLDDLAFDLEKELDNLLPLLFRHLRELHANHRPALPFDN